MDIENLVTMANDISAFFSAEAASTEEATRSVANHLKRYWDPRMRQQIIAHYEASGAELSEIARAAVALLKEEVSRNSPRQGS